MTPVPPDGRSERPVDPAVPRPHLVFLGHGGEQTGPPIILGDLLSGLARSRPWDLTVLLARGGPLVDRYRADGARVEVVASGREPIEPVSAALRRLGQDRAVDLLHDARRRHVARRVLPADLVYVNAATPPTAALLHALAPPPSVPVVLQVHELDVGLRSTLEPADRDLLFDRADHILAVADAVADVLVDGHGIAADRVQVAEGFIDIERVHPLAREVARTRLGVPLDAEVVGSVGLPDWRKDPEHLLRAIAHLADRPGGPPWVVWIGGDPASADGRRLADEARRLGIERSVVHVAHHPNPSELLLAFDVFALPAREDALPLAALESAAAGLALVSFRTGGTAALCDAGAGLAVPYPDTQAFARALAELLDDRERRTRAGARGRELVAERHDATVGVGRIATVLDTVLGERQANRP